MSEADKKSRIPPNSKESEMMVLGCMLTSINALNVAADVLDDTDFYYTEHQILFQVLKAAYRADKPADIHLIGEELKRQGRLENIGGISYLTLLAQYAGTSAYIEEYVDLLREKSILRRMISAAQNIERTALHEPSDVRAALDEAQSQFYQISQSTQNSLGVTLKELISGVKAESKLPFLKELQERQQNFLEKGPGDSAVTGVPTHFTDLDKMLNGFMKSNLILLGARPAMGKCVTGDTLILNPETGAMTSIQELVQRKEGKIVTLGNDWKLKSSVPSAFVADGIKPTFKLTTALGKEIEATAVHPLLTIAGWKRLEELKVGDRIAVPRELPFFGTKKWSEHKLKVLAYLLADGNLTNLSPRFTNNNPKIVEDFREAVHTFGCSAIRMDHRDRTPTYSISLDRTPLKKLRELLSQTLESFSSSQKNVARKVIRKFGLSKTAIYSWTAGRGLPSCEVAIALEEAIPNFPVISDAIRNNPTTEFLKNLGLMGKSSHQKFLPKDLFELTKESLSLFINRLFSCDGTAYVANCGGRPFPVIAYSSVSRTLIYQVQHLLLRFGILSKIRKKKTKCNGKIFPSFELEIHGREDLIRFCQSIGIYGKEAAVKRVLEQAAKSPNSLWTKDTLPLEIWDLILQKKGKKGWGSLFKEKGLPPPSNIHVGKRSIRRDTLERIAHVLEEPNLMQIARSDVYWDRITEITPTGEKEVFDLSVDSTHNFVAGDIIVHNTAFAVNVAEQICFRNKIPVGIFSLEMSADQLLHRLICSQAEVESSKIQTGSLNGSEYQRIVSAVNMMQKHTMIIDDQPGLKITDLRARARRMKEAHDIGFLVIDYLQLIAGSGNNRSQENRQVEVSEISRMLKTLARELNIPVLCAAQLSRKVEERQGHRPMMSDLRESGGLEQDSDVVMFLFRRDYYDKHDKPGLAEIIVAKNRHGAIGDVTLTFRKEIGQFANYTPLHAAADVSKSNKEAFSSFSPEE